MTTATLAGGQAPAARLSPLAGLRNSLTLTWRSVLKIRTNSEDLLGLSLQPIMFLLLFTYVFGGAIACTTTCSTYCRAFSSRPSCSPRSAPA
jgi:oleandomycin transport system permease protein